MSEPKTYPLIIGGEMVDKKETLPVYCKYDGTLYANVAAAAAADVKQAVDAAEAALAQGGFSGQERYEVLMRAAALVVERQAELAEILIRETGKTVQDANNEIGWSVDLFTESAEEAKRIHGETVPFPQPWMTGATAYIRREPVGIVAAITPFNFPFNLVAHKLAPALAAGNPVILKPATVTAVIGWKLCEILLDAGAPKGYVSCLTGEGGKVGAALAAEPRIGFYSFTGSVPVGESLKRDIGLRKCALELGSNSATIVCEDWDPEAAAAAAAEDAFSNAGQVCISMQRVYVHRSGYDTFVKKLAELAAAKKVGDNADPTTEIGPMITEKEAVRVMAWIAEAKAGGAAVHCGDKRQGSLVWPTVLTGVKRDMKVMCDEVFGPVVSVVPFDDVEEAFKMVNDSTYGLNSGILTNDRKVAMRATQVLKTGSVIVGGTCSFRLGSMPYGGVKNSGIGREGPKYAVEEMTEMKTVVLLS